MLVIRLIIVFCLILIRCKLEAQTTKDSLAKKPSFTPHFNYQAYLNGNLNLGNVNRVLIQLGTKMTYKLDEVFKFNVNPYFAYGEQNGVVAERELFTDFSTNIWHNKRFYLLGFGSAESSNLRKIESRYLGGAGVGFKLIEIKGKFFFSITNVLLYEATNYRDKEAFLLLRNSSRFVGDYKFAKNKLMLHHELLVQPAVSQSNLRLNGSASLGVSIIKNLQISLNFRTSYESFVLVNTKNWDFNWSFGLKYSNY